MINLRKWIQNGKSWIFLVTAFFVLFNYCGFQEIEARAQEPQKQTHFSPQLTQDSLNQAHGHEHAESMHHDAQKSDAKDKADFCCSGMFCCTSIQITGDIKQMLSDTFVPALSKSYSGPAIVPMSVIVEPEKIAWEHNIGPPNLSQQILSFLLTHPSHAPPSVVII